MKSTVLGVGVLVLLVVTGIIIVIQNPKNTDVESNIVISPTAPAVPTAIVMASPSSSLPIPTEVVERKPTMNQPVSAKQYTKMPEMLINQTKSYSAVLKTSKGILTIELFPKDAPIAVNNFVFLAREGFYTNTVFHRIISSFMIQGGDPTGTGAGGPGYRFEDEPVLRNYTRGTLAMANAGPDTNGSQFFIMHQDSSSLPKDYVIFGKISDSDTESFKTLDALLATPVTMSRSGEISMPTEEVKLLEVTIMEK